MEEVLTEGALTFSFAPEVVADHYDRWAFYRNQFKDGCAKDNKAVDLLCVGGEKAWLIEVKDYRHYPRTKAVDLTDEVAAKVGDTLAGVVAVSQRANDPAERGLVVQALQAKETRVVCHVAQSERSTRLRQRLVEPDKCQQKLCALLKAIDPHPIVTEQCRLPAALPWCVVST